MRQKRGTRDEGRGTRYEIRDVRLRRRTWKWLYLLPCYLVTLLLCFTGCTPKAKYLIENYTPPEKIAVLPLTNQSVDLDGPVLLRYLFNKHLANNGYDTIPLEEIDTKLREMGITDAGQLPTTTPKEVGEKLNVDGLIYGDVITFNYITLGVYYSRTVHANFKLFDAKKEQLLWEDDRKVSRKQFQFKDIGKAFAKQLIEKTIDKVLRSPLKPEAKQVIKTTLKTLPRR